MVGTEELCAASALGPEVGGGNVWVPDDDALAGHERADVEDLATELVTVDVGACRDSKLEAVEEDPVQVFAWSFKQVLWKYTEQEEHMDGLDLVLKRREHSLHALDDFGTASWFVKVLWTVSLNFLMANFFTLACSSNFFTITFLTNQSAALDLSGIS